VRKFEQTDAETFEHFVYGSADRALARNLMACYLGWWPEDFIGIPKHTAVIERWPMPLSDDELYKRARSSLEEFWYVGIQDRWVEIVKKVYDSFGLPLPPNTVQKPSRNYRALLPKDLLEDVERFNAVDIELYNEYKGRN
jgi:hypothetical protein